MEETNLRIETIEKKNSTNFWDSKYKIQMLLKPLKADFEGNIFFYILLFMNYGFLSF